MKRTVKFFFLLGILCCANNVLAAGQAPQWPQYNPWFFDLGCDSYKVLRDASDSVDVYLYNASTHTFDWFQNLSTYAQKIDYFMEDVGKHFVSVTDESGHTVIYKWRGDKFYRWG